MTPLSELLALKIENLALKMRELEALHAALGTQQIALVAQARSELQAPADWVYAVETRSFQAPPAKPPVPLSTNAARQAKRATS